MNIQKKLIFLLFCLTTTSNIFADYSCNVYSYQDSFSLCNERVKFSKEIDNPDETEYGWIGFLKYYDQSDKLKELLKSSDYLNASKLFNDHKDYFLKEERFKKYRKSFSKIANNLNNNYQVEVDELEKLLIKLNNKLNKSDITETKGRDTFNNIVKFKKQLKVGVRFVAETGRFIRTEQQEKTVHKRVMKTGYHEKDGKHYRKPTREEAEARVRPAGKREPPKWIRDRLTNQRRRRRG